MKRMLAVVALATGVAYGATVNFPDADGSHDISSAAAWGGTLPGTGDTVAITGSVDTTVFASEDVQFGQLQNMLTDGKNYALTFDQSLYPDVKLQFDGFQFNGANKSKVGTRFTGGLWDFGGAVFDTGNNSTSYGNFRSLYVDGGAELTNIASIALGYTSQYGLLFDLGGKAKVYSSGRFKVTNNKTNSADDPNIVRIHDGGYLYVGGDYEWESDASDISADTCIKDYLIVSNGELKVAGTYLYLGRRGNSQTHITANGKVTANSVIGWTAKTGGNRITIDNGGELNGTTFYGGWKTVEGENRCNRFEVLAGGKASFSAFHLGYCNGEVGNVGNTLVVSNGEFTVTKAVDGSNAACSNLTIIVQGKDAKFNAWNGGSFCMFPAPYCEFIVDLGATYRLPCWFSYQETLADGAHHQTFRIRRGGKYDTSAHYHNCLSVNCGETSVVSWANRVIAEQDGFIEGQQLYSGGLEGEIRVDNSTVTLTNLTSDTQMQIGYSNTWGGMGTNCTLTIAGDHPQISLSGGLALHRCSHLVFELPADGYRDGVVPIKAEGKIRLLTGSDIRFTGAEEMYEAHAAAENRASYVLAENPSDKEFFSDAAITAAKASLGDRFRLYARVADGKNQLVLTPRLPSGLMVIFR